ncbi:MAG: DNA replication/repair protein RecF [Flavobacteriales bacterium]|nr:DNA replication/repair protein RecF [Flavobacteriales bacterium]|tara:strand:- start:1462 stop:2559 length:1098 start_codon:yes stop_codon:yes gene_type:complete
MYLKELSLIDFKNYESVQLTFSSNINCFVGDNGEGKTNLLDAIYYLCFCKSYFNSIDSQNIRYEKSFFTLEGIFERNYLVESIFCGLKKGHKKVFKRNKKEYERFSDHIGLFPSVIVSPADINLILEGSNTRRKFMDGVISQSDKLYLQHLISYNKVLSQRNALLKYFASNFTYDSTTISIYNEQLVNIGMKIYNKRCAFMGQFNPIFNNYYSVISGSKEKVELTYKSQLHEQSLASLLEENLTKDKILQYTTCGIHKDDLLFKIGDFSIKKQGSQGQQKTYLISLKLAQFDFIKNIVGEKPLLLLDDIFDKLDDKRVEAIIRLVSEQHFGQIFITDTHINRTENIVKKIDDSYKMFYVNNGIVK